jgi:uncharacterized protein (TIGR00255 family)
MLRSMTAFAKAKKVFSDVEIAIEIQSVNKKHLDMHIKLPAECMLYDPFVRELVSHSLERGHINVSIHVHFLSAFPVKVVANSSYAKSLHEASLQLAEDLGYFSLNKEALFLLLLKERGVLQANFEIEREDFEEKLKAVLSDALSQLVAMKEREGAIIAEEFSQRLDTLVQIKEKIQTLSLQTKTKFYKRLTDLIQELVGSVQPHDERIAKEIALMADRVDIAEELSRFGYHLDHFRTEMKAKKTGKVLEFILQELSREINTMGSKCQDAQVSHLVIEAKSELEKLREQVQNVE